MTILEYDLCRLTPSEVSMDVVGVSIEGGRSLSGVTQAIDYSGGGFIAVTYGGIQIGSRSQHRYWSKLGANLNGSVTPIIVPLWTDYITPLSGSYSPGDDAGVGIPHSDESLFNDGAGYDQFFADAGVSVAAAVNAAQIVITMPAGFNVEGGEWFAIHHLVRNWRAYRIKEVVSRVGQAFTCIIGPPLREAVAIGETASFTRPRCLMRLPAGETLPWAWTAPGVFASLTVNFVEAF
jgi:hypothetical protein